MAGSGFCQLQLTCSDEAEADRIAGILLEKRLVACVRKIPVSSTYHWQGKIEQNEEILLIMDSHDDLFEKVQQQIARMHSYDTFVLQGLPLKHLSSKAERWLKEELDV